MIIIICQNCGKEIITKPSQKGKKKFCNRICRSQWIKKVKIRKWIKKLCPQCGIVFYADFSQTKLGYYKVCSNKCRYEYFKGVKSSSFKGGHIRSDGYRQVIYKGKHWLEHDLVYFLHYGIRATRQQHVHHDDGDKLNNRIENLVLLSVAQHRKKHPNKKGAK